MSTSNTYTWNLQKDALILRAFQEINVYGMDDTTAIFASGDGQNNYNFAVDKLNAMLKTWSADDIKIPLRKRAYLFPALNTTKYAIGNLSGSANCTNSYNSTTITTAAVLGATTLVLSSTSGMTATDNIGIELDDGSRQWTTISVVNSSTQVTLNASLTTTAAVSNTVISYTSKINKPIEILYGTTLDLKNQNNEVSLQMISHSEYWRLPIKASTGRPNNGYYDAVLAGAIPHTSDLYLYPDPQNVWQIITFIYVDQIQDMTNSTDDVNLPQECLEAVWMNLACKLASTKGKFTELQAIQPQADKLYMIMKSMFADKTPLRLKLTKRRY